MMPREPYGPRFRASLLFRYQFKAKSHDADISDLHFATATPRLGPMGTPFVIMRFAMSYIEKRALILLTHHP